MSDYTCRCVPANTASVARSISGVQSNINSVVGRVTDLEEAVEDLDDRVTALESVNESAFTVVDNEAEFDAAMLTGRHILLRGEGNGGEISFTSPKEHLIPGVRVWGYGHESGSTDHFSKIKFDHPNLPAYGMGNLDGIKISASDIEYAGLEIQGNDAVSLSDGSYFTFVVSTATAVNRLRLHDLLVTNVNRVISKNGDDGAAATDDLSMERVRAHTLIGYAVALQRSVNRARIVGCHFNPRPTGYPIAFANTKGIYMTADINDAFVEGNVVENCSNEGIELTSTAVTGSPTTFHSMLRNRIMGNCVKNVGAIGISQGFCTDGIAMGNNVDGAVGIGIESTGGQSAAYHNSQVIGNTIRDITSDNGYCSAISVDRTRGDLITGNKIEDVASTYAGALPHFYARGILVYESRETVVQGNNIRGVDGIGCLVQNVSLDRMLAQHVVENNVFRALSANTKAVHSVYIFDCMAVVRNNTAWYPSSGGITQTFVSNLNNPAVIKPGFAWSADVSGSAAFQESNLVIPY